MDKKSTKETEMGRHTTYRGQSDKKQTAGWEKPVLEDVSGKIMAQPYIRFT